MRLSFPVGQMKRPKAGDAAHRADRDALPEGALVAGEMHETVHLIVAGLALGVFKARIDRVEQLAVPAGALARQDQQLVPLPTQSRQRTGFSLALG